MYLKNKIAELLLCSLMIGIGIVAIAPLAANAQTGANSSPSLNQLQQMVFSLQKMIAQIFAILQTNRFQGNLCGNGACDAGESVINCSKDCPNIDYCTAACREHGYEGNTTDCSWSGVGETFTDPGEGTCCCVKKLAVCGDGVCGAGETTVNCSHDCAQSDQGFVNELEPTYADVASCTASDGKIFPATNSENYARWFLWNGCAKEKTYIIPAPDGISSSDKLIFDVHGDKRSTCHCQYPDFTVYENITGAWIKTAQVDLSGAQMVSNSDTVANTHYYFYSPSADTIKVEAQGCFYLNVYHGDEVSLKRKFPSWETLANLETMPVCGNKFCEIGENETNCPQDCLIVPVCGNKFCEIGENHANCSQDCPVAPGQTGATIMVPGNVDYYERAMTEFWAGGGSNPAATWPFVKKTVQIVSSGDIVRDSAEAAAEQIPTLGGPAHATIAYLKVKNGTAYVFLDIDLDGWAGVSRSLAIIHPLVERTLLQFPQIKRVTFGFAPGDNLKDVSSRGQTGL
jgi:hypothetical protein